MDYAGGRLGADAMTTEQPGGGPILLVCAADDQARRAVVDQLQERYSARYAVRAVGDRAGALRILEETAGTSGHVAILLADDSDDEDGPSIFGRARDLFPDIRRGVLVEWGSWGEPRIADAIRALMAAGLVDYYVIRPWYSPDEYFHRTVTEFLVEWDRAVGVRPREVAVVADPLTRRSHEVRSLLTRGGIPHSFHEAGTPEAHALLAEAGVDAGAAAAVLLHDGRVLVDPTNPQLAAS
jgi:thioredoxin reductase (NADPH)